MTEANEDSTAEQGEGMAGSDTASPDTVTGAPTPAGHGVAQRPPIGYPVTFRDVQGVEHAAVIAGYDGNNIALLHIFPADAASRPIGAQPRLASPDAEGPGWFYLQS
jgi:hypothetical protein